MDTEFGLDVLVTNLEPEINVIISYNNQISSKNGQIYQNDGEMNNLLSAYGISLQETIAGEEEVLMDKPEIKGQYIELRTKNEKLRVELEELGAKRDAEITKIAPKINELRDVYGKAQDAYSTRIAYYNLKIFLLKLLFVLPFFAISLKYYLKYKKIDSPYTIIVTSVFYASTILFLQIVLTFLYNILPRKWFGKIFSFLMSVSILRYVVYYGVTAVVIVFLGGTVYYIQKKIYDPKRVALRQLKDAKCPNCSFNLSLSDQFCPNCGRQIKTKCPDCGNLRYSDLGYCPFCGSKE
jgi:RNA polymerase subunit RPABC4/transcription elongation factor Spt4